MYMCVYITPKSCCKLLTNKTFNYISAQKTKCLVNTMGMTVLPTYTSSSDTLEEKRLVYLYTRVGTLFERLFFGIRIRLNNQGQVHAKHIFCGLF